MNRLECFTLYALFQGVRRYSGAVLIMKLMAASDIVGKRYGAAILLTNVLLLSCWR